MDENETSTAVARLTVIAVAMTFWAVALIGSSIYLGLRISAHEDALERNARAVNMMNDTLAEKFPDQERGSYSPGFGSD